MYLVKNSIDETPNVEIDNVLRLLNSTIEYFTIKEIINNYKNEVTLLEIVLDQEEQQKQSWLSKITIFQNIL